MCVSVSRCTLVSSANKMAAIAFVAVAMKMLSLTQNARKMPQNC